MTTSLQELNTRVARYLSREETLDEFHEWFTAAAVALGRGESDAHGLVNIVDGLFIRLSEEEITEAEFDEGLRGVISVGVTFNATVDDARGDLVYRPDTVWQTNATPAEVSA